jgi:hypothetical protein
MQASFVLPLLISLGLPLAGGSDLCDLIPTGQYWEARSIAVSPETMLAMLRSDEQPPPNVAALVQDLGSQQFAIREQASRELAAHCRSVLAALRKAAESPNAEAARRAADLIEKIEAADGATAINRLMAIRALGELRHREALPVLTQLVGSREAFVDSYARRAIAAIEGKPFAAPRPTREQLDADLGIAPPGTALLLQVCATDTVPLSFDDFVKLVAEQPLLGVPADRGQVARQLRDNLVRLLDQTGNVRIDAVTLALSDHVGPREGFVVISARGRYDQTALRRVLEEQGMMVEQRSGIDVAAPRRAEAYILLPSDEQLVLVSGASPEQLPIDAVIAALAGGKNGLKLKENERLAALVDETDRSGPIWLAVVVSDSFRVRTSPLLDGLDTIAITTKQDGVKLSGTLLARGPDANIAARQAAFVQGLVQQVISELEQFRAVAPFSTFVKALDTFKVSADGASVRGTAELEDIRPLLLMPAASMSFLRHAPEAFAPDDGVVEPQDLDLDIDP